MSVAWVQNRRLAGVVVCSFVLAAFGLGYWVRAPLPGNVEPGRQETSGQESTIEGDEKARASLYVCPMMDVPPMHQPGRCPVCGMTLIEISGGGEQDEGAPALAMNEEQIRLAGVQVVPVERKIVSAEIKLYGQIEYDPLRINSVSVYIPCVIQRVYVERAGVAVMPGTPLFDVYSPELFYAEQELLVASGQVPKYLSYQVLSSQGRVGHVPAQVSGQEPKQEGKVDEAAREAAIQKIAAIRYKMGLLDPPRLEVDDILKKGSASGVATVKAQYNGVVIQQNAVEGNFVNTRVPLVAIADTRYVWAQLDAYESDYLWIKYNQKVELESDAYPGEIFNGGVTYVDPIFDPKKRAFRVGVVFNDPAKKMKPQMFVRARIQAQLGTTDMVRGEDPRVPPSRKVVPDPKNAPLVVPASAPLITGERAVVYVQSPEKKGVYEGRVVVLGPRAKDYYVVREGLKEGELVVVNGGFKIDSAVQILAKPSMMNR